MMLNFLVSWRKNRQWREKLRAFLDGLDCQHVDMIMENSEISDYFRMASALRLRQKLLQIHFDETKTAVDATVSYLKSQGSEPYFSLWSVDKNEADG